MLTLMVLPVLYLKFGGARRSGRAAGATVREQW